MPSALANRFVHLQFEADIDDWTSWAIDNKIRTEVVAFLRFRPALLHAFVAGSDEKAFPSPRAWAFVSRILENDPDEAVEYELLAGTVGEGAATELLGFLRIMRSLPNPDLILMNPAEAMVPEDPAALYAICGALSRKALATTFDQVVAYADRLPAEFSILLIRDAIHIRPELVNTGAYVSWSCLHSNALI
jgi:hypothetical protein